MISLVVLAGAESAEAQSAGEPGTDSRYTITGYQGQRQCPDQAFFEQQLNEALGPPAAAASEKKMEISISITKRKGTFRLDLSTQDPTGSGRRQLRAPSCSDLLATAAIIVSLAMQPDLLYQNESENEVVTASYLQGQASDDESPLTLSPTQSARRSLQRGAGNAGRDFDIAIGIVALTDFGTLPRPAIGAGFVASAQSRLFRLAFRLTQWAEQRRYVQSFEEGRGGNFDYLSASLDLCRELWSARLSVGLCGLLGLGRLNGESILIDLPISQTHITADAGGGAFLQVATGNSSLLRLQAEAVAQFIRPNYKVEVLAENDEEVVVVRHIHKVSSVSGRVAVSWGLTF
jgi:hypothetical protein